MFKGEEFDWFAGISHSTHSEILLIGYADHLLYNLSLIMFGMRNKEHKRCLFIVSKIDII